MFRHVFLTLAVANLSTSHLLQGEDVRMNTDTIVRSFAFLAALWVCYFIADIASEVRAISNDLDLIQHQVRLIGSRKE